MSSKCAIIPRISTLSNTEVKEDSKLFKDLLSFSSYNRKVAKDLYLRLKNPDFIKDWYSELTLDHLNEPTFKSLLDKTNINDYISEEQVLRKLNKDIGYYKSNIEYDRPKLIPNTDSNYKELKRKAIDFNRNSEFNDNYVANVIKIYDNESKRTYINTKISRKNRLNSIDASKMEYNENLNNKLRELLSSYGVSVGTLNNLEERMRINGVTDFDTAKTSADGLVEIIRLAKGIEGEKALPEEFAHFILEAMGDNMLSNRLINLISNNGLTGEILGDDFDTYNTLYEGDTNKLAKEAAGKLLAKHLLRQEPIKVSTYKSLLTRLIDSIKNFFSQFNTSDFQKAIVNANTAFGEFAKQILTEGINNVDINNIRGEGLLYSAKDDATKNKELAQEVLKNEIKRLEIYKSRNSDSVFNTKQTNLINRLQYSIETNNALEGVYSFLENALDELGQLDNRLKSLIVDSSSSLNSKAKVLRDIRNYLFSYQHIVSDIRDASLDGDRFNNSEFKDNIKSALDNTSILLENLFIKYKKTAMPVFVEFLKPYVGNGIEVPFGKFQGKVTSAEQLASIADKDISLLDRWLDSMANSTDYTLKIIDQANKKSKENARLATLRLAEEIKSAAIKLEQSGVKDTKWLYETYPDGTLTGNYISEIDKGLYKSNKEKIQKYLQDKYGDNPVGEDLINYNKEIGQWYNDNLEIVNDKRSPRMSIYGSKAYKNMNSAQREYYNKFMELKAALDSNLPDNYTHLTNTIKIRKDLMERVLASNGLKSAGTQVWEGVKDAFIRRTDDTDFGVKATLIDFEKHEVQSLPIYYTKLKPNENINDISTDATSTLIAYASMANDYKEMSKIIDVLELSRDMLRERKVIQTRGGKPLVEKLSNYGESIVSTLTKSGKETNFIQRLDDYFSMQIYGKYMKDEGELGKSGIDKGKAANQLNFITTLGTMALNLLGGIANVSTGTVMMRIESFSGEFFNEKNTVIGDKNYMAALPEYMSQIGKRVKTNKLALWDEKFNILQEYERDIKNTNFDRKNIFSKLMGGSSLFFMSNAGEHWMQNRTSLALADAYKMKSPNGKVESLWDAMEVVYLDPNNHALGAKLELKKGYTKIDGTEFTKDDLIKFSRKSAAINQRMHGIYNQLDKNAVQSLALGRMGMLYRKWIIPSMNRRFESSTFNYDLDSWTEGYYRTTGRFLLQLAKDLKEGQFTLASSWKNMNKTERANFKRAITEVGHFLLLVVALGLVDWDGGKDRPWLTKMLEYQARRLYTELGALIPGTTMLTEGFKILKSPAAGISTMESSLGLIGLLNPFNYETVNGENALLKSGRYKGDSKATKLFFQSSLVPFNSTIYRALHPDDAVAFYK